MHCDPAIDTGVQAVGVKPGLIVVAQKCKSDKNVMEPGAKTSREKPLVPKCQLSEKELRRIFQAKCEDFKMKFSEKLYQRFEKHQTKKLFHRIFEMESCSLGPMAASAVAETIYRHNDIRVLCLSGNNLGNSGAAAFADLILATRRVIALDLSSNSIGDAGASTIFQALQENKSLYSLKIGSRSGVGRNSFGLKAIQACQAMLFKNHVLAELDLAMTEITADAVQFLANGLMNNKTLQVLNLSDNNIQTRGAAMITSACIEGSRIRDLNIASNHLKDDCAQPFAKFLSQCMTIRALNLSGNSLTVRFANAISGPLASGSLLEELNLSNNPLGGKGIAALGSAIGASTHLKVLNFMQCNIDASGFSEFCQAIRKNTSLVKVMFGYNPIRDEGAKSFAAVMRKHPALKDVDLELCEIGDAGSEELFKALAQAPAMERFSIKNNTIRNGVPIQKAVSDNPRILFLNAEYNDIDFKVFTEIQRAVKTNQKMWRDNQKQRIENAVTLMAEVNGKLSDTRSSITEERQMIDLLTKKLQDTKDYLVQAEVDKVKHLEDLERKLTDVSNEADRELTAQRDEQEKMRAELSKLESETSATHSKNDREIMNFQRECKTLKQVEADLAELKKNSAETDVTLTHKLQEAKLRYKDCLDMFKAAWQQLQDERAEAQRQKELAEAAANAPQESTSRRKGKTSRRKSPRKGSPSKASKKSPEPAQVPDDTASQRSEGAKSQRSVAETASQRSGQAAESPRSLTARSNTATEPAESADAGPRHEEAAAPAPAQDATVETPKRKKSKKASGSTKKARK